MMRAMPSPLFAEWQAFFSIHPFGEVRADLRAGIIASTIANAMSTVKRKFRPIDFMVNWDRPSRQQTEEEMKAQFRGFMRAVEKNRERRGIANR